jgi:hypothetical protein
MLGIGQAGDPLGGGGELDALAGQARADRDRYSQMGLAGAGRGDVDLLGAQRRR